MNIDQLSARIVELDKAIVNTNQSLYMLHGHKAEAAFQLDNAKKEAEALEVPPAPPVE